jgi:dTDP-4-dehydrorhamnose reductase
VGNTGEHRLKNLIIGARGLVGSALARKLPEAVLGMPVEPKHPNERYTDIAKYESLFKAFSKDRPDVVYLPAAIAHVDRCEESAGTDAVNVRGALNVLRLCESFGSKLVYFSSSYVFDGKKKTPYSTIDETNPVNKYGLQKDLVEKAIYTSDADYLVIRTVGVFGTERLKKNFAKQVISAIFSGQKVFAPTDQSMNPILSDDLARISIRLAERKCHGLYHVAGDACLSKYEFAKRIANQFDLGNMVEPRVTEEMQQKAKRPKNACLDCTGLGGVGILVPSFEGGLVRFLAKEFNG